MRQVLQIVKQDCVMSTEAVYPSAGQGTVSWFSQYIVCFYIPHLLGHDPTTICPSCHERLLAPQRTETPRDGQ